MPTTNNRYAQTSLLSAAPAPPERPANYHGPETAPQPSRNGTHWYLKQGSRARRQKPTIARACELLELPHCPKTAEDLRRRMVGWRHGSEGPWGAACGTVEEWIAVKQAQDAYLWLRARLREQEGGGQASAEPYPIRRRADWMIWWRQPRLTSVPRESIPSG